MAYVFSLFISTLLFFWYKLLSLLHQFSIIIVVIPFVLITYFAYFMLHYLLFNYTYTL